MLLVARSSTDEQDGAIEISNRSRQRAPHLTSFDRFVVGLITLCVRPHRIPKLAAMLASHKPCAAEKLHSPLACSRISLPRE